MKIVDQLRFGEQCWGRVEWPQHTTGYCTVPAHADLMAGMDKRWRAFIGDEAGSSRIAAMEEDKSLSQNGP